MSERSQQKWTRIKVDPAVLRQLMQRQDARPLRDMLSWLGLMGLFMGLTIFMGQLVGGSAALCLRCFIQYRLSVP